MWPDIFKVLFVAFFATGTARGAVLVVNFLREVVPRVLDFSSLKFMFMGIVMLAMDPYRSRNQLIALVACVFYAAWLGAFFSRCRTRGSSWPKACWLLVVRVGGPYMAWPE